MRPDKPPSAMEDGIPSASPPSPSVAPSWPFSEVKLTCYSSSTAPTASYTPAADKLFRTVELAETILKSLSLAELHIAMRTCKSFCTIIKTSKLVVRDSPWLSLRWSRITQDPAAAPLPMLKQYLSFVIPETSDRAGFVLEMTDSSTAEEASRVTGLATDKSTVKYFYTIQPDPAQDTIITVDSINSSELWRRLPLGSGSRGGVDVQIVNATGKDVQSVKNFPETLTLGDMLVWLCDEVATFSDPPHMESWRRS